MRPILTACLMLLASLGALPSKTYFVLSPTVPSGVWDLAQQAHQAFMEKITEPLGLKSIPPVRVYLAMGEGEMASILESDFAVPGHLAGVRAQDPAPVIHEVAGVWRIALRADGATNGESGAAFHRNLTATLWSAVAHPALATAKTPALPWILTGAPEWMGAWMAAKMDQEPIDAWRNRTARATTGRSPNLLVHDLLVEKGPAALGPYLKNLNLGMSPAEAFTKAFESTEADFFAGFDKRVANWRVKQASLTFSPFEGQPEDLLPVVRDEAGRIRKYFNETWSWPLRESRRVTVTAEPTVLGDNWERYVVKPIFDFDRSGSNAVPWILGEEGTLVSIGFDLTPKARRKILAEVFIAGLLTDTAPLDRLDQLAWMRRGLGEVAMAFWAESEGDRFLVNAERAWRDGWDKRTAPFSLARLRTAPQWDALATNVGAAAATGLAAITVETLFNEMGPAPFKAWCKAMNTRTDVEKCFKDIFGQDLTAYEEKVRQSLF